MVLGTRDFFCMAKGTEHACSIRQQSYPMKNTSFSFVLLTLRTCGMQAPIRGGCQLAPVGTFTGMGRCVTCNL